jgi:predicted amidophosphoribosyltransferase
MTNQTASKYVLLGAGATQKLNFKLRGSMPCVKCGKTVSANAGVCAACLEAMARRVVKDTENLSES